VQPDSTDPCQGTTTTTVLGFTTNDPLDLRLSDGDQVLGSARYAGMFPGAEARVIDPTPPTVRVGDSVLVMLPAVVTDRRQAYLSTFYWLDPPPGITTIVPTSAPVSDGPDDRTLQITVPVYPALTGRAKLSVNTSLLGDDVAPESCSGFGGCVGHSTAATLGPMDVTVLSP
jgi:hypothetical protein